MPRPGEKCDAGDGGAGHTHIPCTVPGTTLRDSAAKAAGPTSATVRRGHFKCCSSSSACDAHAKESWQEAHSEQKNEAAVQGSKLCIISSLQIEALYERVSLYGGSTAGAHNDKSNHTWNLILYRRVHHLATTLNCHHRVPP